MHLGYGCILFYCTGRVSVSSQKSHIYIFVYTGKQVKKRQTMKVFYISVEDLHEAGWATEVKHNSFVYKV